MSGERAVSALVGQLVQDAATGRVGELMAVVEWDDPARQPQQPQRQSRLLAFLRPCGGGREWTTAPGDVTALAPHRTPPATARCGPGRSAGAGRAG